MIPTDLYYAKTHEYLRVVGQEALIGITDHAAEQLGDVVFADLPAVGQKVQSGDTIGALESVKAVSDLYAPVAGEVIEVNAELEAEPGLINEDPYNKGWIIKMTISDPSQVEALLKAEDYEKWVEEGH